jgi:hypothetical protein
MRVIINESTLLEILSQEFDESVGVPSNMQNAAKQIEIDFFQKIRTIKTSDFKEELFRGEDLGVSANMDLRGPYQVADMVIDVINVSLEVTLGDSSTIPEIYGFAASSQSYLDYDKIQLKDVSVEGGKAEMYVRYVLPSPFNVQELIKVSNEMGTTVSDNFAHELMHVYEIFKKKTERVTRRSGYAAAADRTNFHIKTVNDFFFNQYYIDDIESTVRPSELAMIMKNNDVKADKFKDFLFGNETYKQLKQIQGFTFEKFKEDIRNEMPRVNKLLDHINSPIVNGTDDEKINEILRIAYSHFSMQKIKKMKEHLTANFFDQIQFPAHKKAFMDKYYNRVARFKNHPEEFFKYEEKRFQEKATKVIKRIAKLYAIAKRDED